MSLRWENRPFHDRDNEIYSLRLNGSKFTDIGQKFGISSSRAAQIFEREARRSLWFARYYKCRDFDLTMRLISCLESIANS